MVLGRLRLVLLLLHCFAFAIFAATTTTVSVTSTTTVHVTATDYRGACDNFVGACVVGLTKDEACCNWLIDFQVYGSNGGARYTTTVYVYSPLRTASSTSTETTTILATTTVSDGAACRGFSGACVVYGGSASASTVYYPASSQGHLSAGNGNGYIGLKNGGDGFIHGGRQFQRVIAAVAVLISVGLALIMWN